MLIYSIRSSRMASPQEMRPSVDLTNEAQHVGIREVSLEHAERKSMVDHPDPVFIFMQKNSFRA